MKKYISVLITTLLTTFWVNSATFTFHYEGHGLNEGVVNGLPVTQIKIYYGPSYKTYTNSVVYPLNYPITTNKIPAQAIMDSSCARTLCNGYCKEYKVTGLVLYQPVYVAYTYLNQNNEEAPYMIEEALCSFMVTNNTGIQMISSPTNLKIQSPDVGGPK